MKIIKLKNLKHLEIELICSRQAAPTSKVKNTVNNIIGRVRREGDRAVLEYARQLDGLKGGLKVTSRELKTQAGKCGSALKKAMNKAIRNVTAFHNEQLEKSWRVKGPHGTVLGQIIRPLHRVGIYVPGGSGDYPSTVIMNATPARVGGVRDIAAATPVSGLLKPALAYAFNTLGISEVYKIGGAQAVAMLALGTNKVRRVDKIVGPGNVYATLAKKELFGEVDIDMIAGPSEILVMADETADPDWVAADLLSQAEHGSGYEAAVCITTSEQTAVFVEECVRQQVESSPKKLVLQKALRRFGRIFVVPNWEKGCELADRIAPEHLELCLADPQKWIKRLHNAGAIFAGHYATEPVGDYFAGPNHVLPTNGSARFFSPLGVYDFIKRTSYIRYGEKALKQNGRDIIRLAECEGFFHHAEAVKKRL